MCVIVDANLASLVFGNPTGSDFVPVVEWLAQKGCLVYGGKLADELGRIESARRLVLALQRAGRARLVDRAKLEAEEMNVKRTRLCQSNDLHIIALALVSGARTLCSRDVALHRDFKNWQLISRPRGSVYQTAEHKRLLRHTPSCRRG